MISLTYTKIIRKKSLLTSLPNPEMFWEQIFVSFFKHFLNNLSRKKRLNGITLKPPFSFELSQ